MTEAAAPDPAESPEAHLHRVDAQIALLTQQAEGYRLAWGQATTQLGAAHQQRQHLLRQLHAGQTTGPTAGPPLAPAAETPSRPETSTRTAQNILFALGGLLLATAAIVFTAVAWATFGNGGRAVILGSLTVVTLAVPLLALRRGLRATGETFAVLGLLLVVLDGYAAWYVNLFGAKAVPTLSYVAIVCAVTAGLAAGYHLATGLTGAGVAGVLMVQPVLPLLAAEADATVAGWALLMAALAAGDLALHAARRDPVVRGFALAAHWCAVAASAVLAVRAEIEATGPAATAMAGLAVIVAAVVLGLRAALQPNPLHRAAAAAVLVVSVGVAGTRLAAAAWPSLWLVAVAATASATAVLAVLVARVAPATARPGLRVGALVVTGVLGAALTAPTIVAAVDSLRRTVPVWQADLASQVRFDWQLPAAIALATLGLMAWATSAPARVAAVSAGAVLATLALPGALPLTWWAPSTLDLTVAAALAVTAVTAATHGAARAPAVGAGVLGLHAVAASLSRPANTAAILAGLALCGLVVAGLSRRSGEHRVIGWVAAFVGLASVPPAIGAGLVAAPVDPLWTARLTALSVLTLILGTALIARGWPDLTTAGSTATLVSAVVWPPVAAFAADEPVGIYTGGALVAVALAFATARPVPRPVEAGLGPFMAAAAPLGLLYAVDVVPALLGVLVLPYSWLGAVWSGAPGGVGLVPDAPHLHRSLVTGTDAVALGLLAVAAAVTAYALRPRLRSVVAGLAVGGPSAVLVGLTAAQAPWPVVPATTMVLGLLLTAAVAVTPVGALRTGIAVTQGLLYVGAGLAGSLTTQWSTLVALGSTVVVATVVAWFGVSRTWRILGWCAAVAAAVATVTAAGLAADLPLRATAFAVTGVAALALALGTWLRQDRPAEATALQACAHVVAVVPLTFVDTPAYAAAVCTVWGVVVAVRAVAPATGRAARLGLAAAAAGWEVLAWWLLLVARDVAVIEAYTLPLAAVALLAGWAALRARPGLSSWIAYGPALAAAFLPSLATIVALTVPPAAQAAPEWRRLLLGLAALAVVVGGSQRRRQAPVMVGGAVLALVALHETVLIWDLVPRWVPLALGGLLLVGLAMTYERRRRDMARLRTAIARMT